jgi:hypothetical protein
MANIEERRNKRSCFVMPQKQIMPKTQQAARGKPSWFNA